MLSSIAEPIFQLQTVVTEGQCLHPLICAIQVLAASMHFQVGTILQDDQLHVFQTLCSPPFSTAIRADGTATWTNRLGSANQLEPPAAAAVSISPIPT
jgi:hypothetical protein